MYVAKNFNLVEHIRCVDSEDSISTMGVPQNCVLSPIPFLFYINNLDNIILEETPFIINEIAWQQSDNSH